MKYPNNFLLVFVFITFFNTILFSETIYQQNFGSVTTEIPAGWTSSNSAGWYMSSTFVSGVYTGASGGCNFHASQAAAIGTYFLTLENISTINYTDITVLWGARRSGSCTTIVYFEWSKDGLNWNPVSFTDVTAGAPWGLVNNGTRISLPAQANNASNLRLRWSFTSTGLSSWYKIDDFSIEGIAVTIKDGDGSAALINADIGNVLYGTKIFPAASSSQSVEINVIGNSALPLTNVSVDIPSGWSGLDIDSVTLSGAGFDGAQKIVLGNTLTVQSANLTNTDTGKIIISALTTPNPSSSTADSGCYYFRIKTAKSDGTLTAINVSPNAYVIIKIGNLRFQNSDGISLLNNKIVAVKGTATIQSGSFDSHNIDMYIQDETGGTCVFKSGYSSPLEQNNEYYIFGTVSQINGLTKISATFSSDIINNGTAAPINYTHATIPELIANPENYEGKLIAVSNLSITGTALWPVGLCYYDTSIILKDVNNATINLIIFGDNTECKNQSEPVWPQDIVGIFYQRDSTSPYVGNFSTYYIVPRTISDFYPAGSLPVEITSVNVFTNGFSVIIEWSTATEKDNYGFEIQRQLFGSISWEDIGFIPGAGASATPHSYYFIDKPEPGKYSYRLKQIDNDGSFKYYNAGIAEMRAASTLHLSQNFPNPFNPETKLNFSVPENGRAVIKIYSVLGQEVATLFDGLALSEKANFVTFKPNNLPSGIYFAKLSFENRSIIRSMIYIR